MLAPKLAPVAANIARRVAKYPAQAILEVPSDLDVFRFEKSFPSMNQTVIKPDSQ
jgi:hypothetical protein